MKVETDINENVEYLVNLKKQEFLTVNHEYQRAPVWNEYQKKMFIDSIFRGYSIPAFYLHFEQKNVGGLTSEKFSIIDGQQRINALYEYFEGSYALLDPGTESTFKFPNFFKGEECPWAAKRYKELDKNLKDKFLSQSVVIYRIETDEENKIRDLFIRLQGGTPLTSQEKRDSWPGKFTEYMLSLGGKSGVARYPGNDFFIKTAKPSGSESNRRKLAAQVAMLYFNKCEKNEFCDIKSKNIDQFYHQKIDFDATSDEVKRFEKILSILTDVFRDSKPLKAHYAIGMVLLVDNLLNDYAHGWKDKLRGAFDKFNKAYLASQKATKEGGDPDDYYNLYVLWTGTKTDLGTTIRRRHYFFVEKMLQSINPTQKDSVRAFTDTQREIIFHRDKRICQVCKMRGDETEVTWDSAQIHHVNEHQNGGQSILENGALVHAQCHPRKKEDVDNFHEWWETKEDDSGDVLRKFPPPEETACRFAYKGREYRGIIEKKKLVVDQHGSFNSFSEASANLTDTSRNGWEDWELIIPGQNDWTPADEWRRS